MKLVNSGSPRIFSWGVIGSIININNIKSKTKENLNNNNITKEKEKKEKREYSNTLSYMIVFYKVSYFEIVA